MRRFDYEENDEYRDEVDKFFNMEDDEEFDDEEYKALLEDEIAIQQLQIDTANRDLKHKLLLTSIDICNHSIKWWFCSHKTRLNMIAETYKTLKNLEEDDAVN